jgi:thiosulfate/3-mercaptopyruvate sulfurtransferase
MFTTLIDASTLSQHLSDPRWVILDCRHDLMDPGFGRKVFAEGHIENAQFANIDSDLSGPKSGADGVFRGRHPLPERALLLETLRAWGINEDSQVVAYDAHGGMYAARLWWLLRWVGHGAAAVLDGGLAAWNAAGLPLVAPVTARPRGNIADQPALVRTVSVGTLVENLAAQRLQVVDARANDRFRGENETIDPVGGHIPGARNRFFKDNLLADGRFKDAATLRQELSALVGAPAEAVMQCGSGVTACHNLLALEVAGLTGAALYPGSWSEWCADSSRPIATGPA